MDHAPIADAHLQEIAATRSTVNQTFRPTVPALENIMFTPFPRLDHGFIRLVDYMGDDAAIVQAARVSYGAGTKSLRDDTGLIRYLLRHHHTTPLEMCEIKFHVKMPIFVARQWIRHRTANVNEASARYSILDKEFYIPAPENLAAQSRTNRQGRGDVLSGDEANEVLRILRADAERCYDDYAWMLNDDGADQTRDGLARELARMNLTLNTYTQWYWKTDLHNLLGFLRLRADSHAQYEIRVYAETMMDIVKLWTPIAAEAFNDYVAGAHSLSRMEANLTRDLISEYASILGTGCGPLLSSLMHYRDFGAEEKHLLEKYGLSKRELKDFIEAFVK